LIARFIDKEAEFVYVPAGVIKSAGDCVKYRHLS
jgi:hypothetical protein